MLVEPNGFQASLDDVLGPLSGGSVAVSVYWNVNLLTSIGVARDGEVIGFVSDTSPTTPRILPELGGEVPVSLLDIVTWGFVAQARQCFQNIRAVLAEGGAAPHHVVRLTWYVVDVEEYLAAIREVGRAYRETFGSHFPAMAVVGVVRLVEPAARLEIEATAILPTMAVPVVPKLPG